MEPKVIDKEYIIPEYTLINSVYECVSSATLYTYDVEEIEGKYRLFSEMAIWLIKPCRLVERVTSYRTFQEKNFNYVTLIASEIHERFFKYMAKYGSFET